MAPRGRPRKPRLMRIDAAVDAMTSFGFSEEIVRKTVKELLKEYGGDEGWRFIEDNSYIELIEAILRSAEGNNQEKSARHENHTKDAPAEASCVATDSLQVTETADGALLDAVGSSSVSQLPCAKESKMTQMKIHGRHRLPCFGWLESDEEDDPNDFVFFNEKVESTPTLHPDFSEDPKNVTNSNGKRNSPWDEILSDHHDTSFLNIR
ncbi:probable inactive histone-lysine N-methyltransferase SUVR1 [Olea europaea subsp. europaea]|uniref:Probable inactive histone-lysine N-methyltransferase SUVR1 n=1 Tax=Olea europaea subsp. europaea TaxID=158383 RepID=A0A8S0U573_OLEEU|nr:probable inactive histone-lysine N-methyltransferase SUVR1 [Olea europaea subsp. europaea]